MFTHQLHWSYGVFDPQKASRPIIPMSYCLCPLERPGIYHHTVVLTSLPPLQTCHSALLSMNDTSSIQFLEPDITDVILNFSLPPWPWTSNQIPIPVHSVSCLPREVLLSFQSLRLSSGGHCFCSDWRSSLLTGLPAWVSPAAISSSSSKFTFSNENLVLLLTCIKFFSTISLFSG